MEQQDLKLTDGEEYAIYVTRDMFIDHVRRYDHVFTDGWVVGRYNEFDYSFMVDVCGEHLFEINRHMLTHITVLNSV